MNIDEFTMEAVRLFIIQQNGVCTNHDLVARFKPYLNHAVYKHENRAKLKEFVQLLTSVETRDGERVLVIKKRYNEMGCLQLFPNQDKLIQSAGDQPAVSNVNISKAFLNPEPPTPSPPSPVDPPAQGLLYDELPMVPAADVFEQAPAGADVTGHFISPPDIATHSISTPDMDNDLPKKSPMSAKERIRQFDQISTDNVGNAGQAPDTNQYSSQVIGRQEPSVNNDLPEYDGGINMVSLDSKEKEWMLMSSACDYHAMCKLLKERPDLAHRRDFVCGYNAMHWAAKHGKPETIKLLHGYKVDANLRSFCGYTPVHLAAMAGNEECIDILINLCKVKPNTRDFYGRRPKQYLKKNCSTRIQQMLLSSARQSFTLGITVDDPNAFARTQSFSAKIMKTTQGLARKFSTATRGSVDNVRDVRDSISEIEPEEHRSSLHNINTEVGEQIGQQRGSSSGSDLPHSFKQWEHSRTEISGLKNSSGLARCDSAPEIPPADSQGSFSGFTNIHSSH